MSGHPGTPAPSQAGFSGAPAPARDAQKPYDAGESPQSAPGPRRSRLARKLLGKIERTPAPSAAPVVIATPAPGSFDRSVPATDVTDEHNRTTHYTTITAEASDLAKLRCQNIWERARDAIEVNLVEELRLRAAAGRLRHKAEIAEGIASRLTGEPGTTADARVTHRKLIEARRAADLLTFRAAALDTRARQIRMLIDGTADRVGSQVAIVIGHFWLEYDRHARANPAEQGNWRTQDDQRAATSIRFDDVFGRPEIPTSEEISALILQRRRSLASEELATWDEA